MNLAHIISVTVITFLQLFFIRKNANAFLLDGPKVDCPNPATNCLHDVFNWAFESLGCLGCQSGCQSGYIMVANPRYYVTGGSTTETYEFNGINILKSNNVSEPQWLCLPGDSCPYGFYLDPVGIADSCAYCGEGCSSCKSYGNCERCYLGYRLTQNTLPGGRVTKSCVSSGIKCPNQTGHCLHEVHVSSTVGCQGCSICEDGYLPTYDTNYRRAPENKTSNYDYQGITISGIIEINNNRYNCVQGDSCQPGWHNVTRGELVTCEVDMMVIG